MNEHDFLEMKSQVDRETAANETEHASFRRRIGALEEAGKERTEMLLAIQRQGTAIENIGKKVDRVSTDLEEIKERPAKRWDSVVSVIITALATAFVTYILTAAGLN